MDVHAVQGGMVLNPEVVVEFGSPGPLLLEKGLGVCPLRRNSLLAARGLPRRSTRLS